MEPNLRKYNRDLKEEFLTDIAGEFSRCYAGIKNCRFQYGRDSLYGTPFLLIKPEHETLSLGRALQLVGIGNTDIALPTPREVARYSHSGSAINSGYRYELLNQARDQLGKDQYAAIEHQLGQSLSLVDLRVKKILDHIMHGISRGKCLHEHLDKLDSVAHK